ncbi:restriction endonuclease subunit S [Paenibacillus sp. FSL R10-2199]|uniref:restriction endonuclease subunit S n=1 Tax=Paenibacillus sp. FSL R10-2199 TaxID=2975348 RepID=UPI0030F71796
MSFRVNGWKEVQLGDVCTLITDGSHTSPPSVEKGYYMASVKDMDKYEFNLENCRMISESDFRILVKNGCKPQYGDVLIGKDGARYLEDVLLFKQTEDIVLLSSIAILRPDMEKILPRFLYYFLNNKTTKNYIKSNYGSGSAIPRMVLKDFKRVLIFLPPLQEQIGIEKILASLDDKIELNNRMNKVLEQMAQAIFKQWFVDFEFPNENGEPYKSSGGEMEWCEDFGKDIPIFWKYGKLEELCEITSSKRIFMSDYKVEGIPFYRSKEIIEKFKGNTISTELFISEEKFNEIDKKHGSPSQGDILLTSVGTLGVPYLVSIEKFYFKDGNLTWFRNFKEKYYSQFIYNWLLYGDGENQIDNITIGSTQKAITIQGLKNVNIITPPHNVLEKYELLISTLSLKCSTNISSNACLSNLRDTLLPKLMSGEIDVSQVEL